MSKLNVVIVALCAHAAGLAIGLVVASLGGASLPMVAFDQDARALREARQTIDDLKAEAEYDRQYAVKMGAQCLKTNAFIGLLIDYPVLREVLLEPPVSDSFEGKDGWWYPQSALGLLGGRWLADELIADGLMRQTDLDAGDILRAVGELSAAARRRATRAAPGGVDRRGLMAVGVSWRGRIVAA